MDRMLTLVMVTVIVNAVIIYWLFRRTRQVSTCSGAGAKATTPVVKKTAVTATKIASPSSIISQLNTKMVTAPIMTPTGPPVPIPSAPPVSTKLSATSANVNEVVVHRRPIYGVGKMLASGDGTFSKSKGKQLLLNDLVYNPFAYAVPPPQKGTTRKFRLYAVYTDTITKGSGPALEFRFGEKGDKGVTSFQFPLTVGGTTQSRDAYSNEISDVQAIKQHANIYTYTTGTGAGTAVPLWRFHYIEVQTLDV